MSGAFGLAGFYFGRKPTSASSEADVSVANSSMPWEVDHEHEDETKHFKYQYHPKGDRSSTPKNAPSALNTVIVPNVTLPKVRYFPAWFFITPVLIRDNRNYMISSTSGERKDIKQRMQTDCVFYELYPSSSQR